MNNKRKRHLEKYKGRNEVAVHDQTVRLLDVNLHNCPKMGRCRGLLPGKVADGDSPVMAQGGGEC